MWQINQLPSGTPVIESTVLTPPRQGDISFEKGQLSQKGSKCVLSPATVVLGFKIVIQSSYPIESFNWSGNKQNILIFINRIWIRGNFHDWILHKPICCIRKYQLSVSGDNLHQSTGICQDEQVFDAIIDGSTHIQCDICHAFWL